MNEPQQMCDDIGRLLRYRVERTPDRVAFTMLKDGEEEVQRWTYEELDRQARAIAGHLQDMALPGERALLVFPPGLEFVAAFFGCLYAGLIGVPVHVPKQASRLSRLRSIQRDASPAVGLTTRSVLPRLRGQSEEIAELGELRWAPVEDLDPSRADAWMQPRPSRDDLAYLQYTSGSTASPKGVMITHRNVLSNLAAVRRASQTGHEDTAFVTWVPAFHDLGLVWGILQPIYVGRPCWMMAPTAFLRKPVRWLKTISDVRATHSAGPNFGFELCLKKVPDRELDGLDLSPLRVCFNGAEPVQADTLDRFHRRFSPAGLRSGVVVPAYGLAEATLLVSTAAGSDQVAVRRSVPEPTGSPRDSNGSGVVVSNGPPADGVELAIVDPESRRRVEAGRLGEIWVAGPSVARGYWRRPEATEEEFRAFTEPEGEGPFLRTGDVGFQEDGEVFIAGRIKDLIILRGQNYYPQDIEFLAERSHPDLRPACGAAFSVTRDGEERLVLVQEVQRRPQAPPDAIIESIRRSVADELDLHLHEVVLLRIGAVPRTSSGKIQRRACQHRYLDGSLDVVARSVMEGTAPAGPTAPGISRQDLLGKTPGEARRLVTSSLRGEVARALGADVAQVDPSRPLSGLGLDSLQITEVINAVEAGFGVELERRALIGSGTLEDLSEELTRLLESPPRSADDGPGRLPERPLERPARLPLTLAQERQWVLDQIDSGPGDQVAVSFTIAGRLVASSLAQALDRLLTRHEALRVRFGSADGEPYQTVSSTARWPLARVDLSALGARTGQRVTETLVASLGERPFDLRSGPLVRGVLLRVSDEDHALTLAMHHIAADGWSAMILLRELSGLYQAFSGGRPDELDPVAFDYCDFALWQRRAFDARRIDAELEFWRSKLQGLPDVLSRLPAAPASSREPGRHRFTLAVADGVVAAIEARARNAGFTPFVLYLGLFSVLLRRLTGGLDRFALGTDASGRARTGTERIVGNFTTFAALCLDLRGDPPFFGLLERISASVGELHRHQDVPFEKVVSDLYPDPDLTHLRRIRFDYDQFGAPDVRLAELDVRFLEVQGEPEESGLSLELWKGRGGELRGLLKHSSDLLGTERGAALTRQFQELVKIVTPSPDLPLSALEQALADRERRFWRESGDELQAKSLSRLRRVRELTR